MQLASKGVTTTSPGMTHLHLNISHLEYDEEFMVIDDLADDVILGDPWLQRARVTLDYGLRCIHHGVDHRATTFWSDQQPPPPGMPLPQVQHGFPEDLKAQFMNAIQDFSVITDHSGCVGAVRAVHHVIRLEKDEPFRLRPYPMSNHKSNS